MLSLQEVARCFGFPSSFAAIYFCICRQKRRARTRYYFYCWRVLRARHSMGVRTVSRSITLHCGSKLMDFLHLKNFTRWMIWIKKNQNKNNKQTNQILWTVVRLWPDRRIWEVGVWLGKVWGRRTVWRGGGRLKDSHGGCFEFHVFLLGIWWEEDRKWSSVEVNGLLTRQDRRPAVCVCVLA